ncbi:IMP dehydrogenase [Coxiella endosymbiont of Amblyomma americanum]|uniref:IMP dehydrogenase n=1 Tax=Coxiella endosymbiont of Amblyomma americanum TaxID=325775 RepID=UPI00057E2AB1|nr:IMP dehydrogenase [Coxiella endosymbiont of Amblyomma americanum]AJC50535.1 inosine-5-monophosphate dehydrogenase [Coxiella endosymbiont of Amblyomma americanum]AUJ58869.1 IMP dehydrogenase [Coxiella-like endosymbiont of Amblyomma americanum]
MRINEEALTFDDVLLLPDYSEILPRDVLLTTNLTRNITLNVPLLSAAMDTVTEARLAIALAEAGGMGILHKNMSPERQANEVRKVKKFESVVVFDPVIVSPDSTIRELKEISSEYNISGLPVVKDKQLVGIITNRDIRFELDMEQKVASLMTPKERLITIKENATREEIINLFRRHSVEKLLVVNGSFELCGLITVKDILRSEKNPNSCKTVSGQLRVGAAINTGDKDPDRIPALVSEGVDILVVDTAHGHSKQVIDRVKWIKQHYPDVPVIAGNIATAAAARALANSGADAIKVGIGPGSICITRIIAGIGVPQITAIAQVASELKNDDISIIADGGVRFSGDICKAIAAGAHAVMIGGLFAGTEEAPGEEVLYQGRSYKSYRGMGSTGAMFGTYSSSDRYFQESQKSQAKYVPEGIEGRVPYKGPLRGVVHQLIGGLRSGMGYTGCKTIMEMRTKTRFVRITSAGIQESHVHDVTITRESPNYSLEK